jgi:YidC/Oxa1 family membrane protein insertase
LPTLIQLPIILGLYQSVTRAMAASPLELFNLQQIIYPKWINAAKLLPLENQFLWMDLGQPERVSLFGLSIPLLAILVVVTTYVQSKLIQPPSSPDNQAAMMTNSMNIYMPILMGFMAYSLASGLAVYFLTSNLFGIAQYAILGRANWSNILPFLKKKGDDAGAGGKGKVVDAKVKPAPEPVKQKPAPKASSKSASNKKIHPPRKKRN